MALPKIVGCNYQRFIWANFLFMEKWIFNRVGLLDKREMGLLEAASSLPFGLTFDCTTVFTLKKFVCKRGQ